MPDDKGKGGTSTEETKTFSQEDYDKAVADATKAGETTGRTAAQAHFQSVADKGIAAAGSDADELRKTVAELNAKVLEGLPEEQRPMAEVRQALAEIKAMRETSTPKPKSDDTGVTPAPSKGNPQQEVTDAVKDLGIDTDGLPFDKGLKPFLAEVAKRLETKQEADKKEASKKEDDNATNNSISTSSSSSGSGNRGDMKNPAALIISGVQKRFEK